MEEYLEPWREQTAHVEGCVLADSNRGVSVCQSSPILREVMSEEVVGGQFDGFLWRDQC